MSQPTSCGPSCVLAEKSNLLPLSASARPDGAWIHEGLVVRQISTQAHEPSHPFALEGDEGSGHSRAELLKRLAQRPCSHVVPVSEVCSCSFSMPFLQGTPLQELGLGFDQDRLVSPSARRLDWPAVTLHRLLAELAQGLLELRESGIAHGDPAWMNAFASTEADGARRGRWVDLNSVRPATSEASDLDVAAFLLTTLIPALLDAPQHSPSLFADLAAASRHGSNVLESVIEALKKERLDLQADGARASLGRALAEHGSASDRADGIGQAHRRVSAHLASQVLLDQTRSDQNARFFRATLTAERTRNVLLEEERTRLHLARFGAEQQSLQRALDEMRAYSEQQREAIEYHAKRADGAEEQLRASEAMLRAR